LAPFAALAQVPGATNTATTSAGSNASVGSTQATMAAAKVGGNGGVLVGAISGNTTSVQTSALGVAGPAGSSTLTSATQYNVGGTISGGLAINAAAKRMPTAGLNGASGFASGSQTSAGTGTASAHASNVNVTGISAPKPGAPK
jgi:hypothetical protein